MNTPSKLHTTRGLSTTCVVCEQNIIEATSEICPGPPMPEGGAGDQPAPKRKELDEIIEALHERDAEWATMLITVFNDAGVHMRECSNKPNDHVYFKEWARKVVEKAQDRMQRPEPTMPSGARMSVQAGTAAPQLSKPQAPRDPDIYARAARSILGMSTEPNEYVRVTMCASTRQWLRDRMAALRLDVLIERKHLLRERGPRADLHDRLLETLEHDLIEINRITDALL
jgi:hypothetical protein